MTAVTEIDRSRVYDATTHEPHDTRWVLIWTGSHWRAAFRGDWFWCRFKPSHWREMLEGPNG